LSAGTTVVDIQVRHTPDHLFLTVTEDPTPSQAAVMDKYLVKFADENDDFPDARVFGPYTSAGSISGVVWLHHVGRTLLVNDPGDPYAEPGAVTPVSV
jgi:hypothetical protein